MLNRFRFPLSTVGQQAITKASTLKVQVHKRRDGKLSASFKLCGWIGASPFEDDDDDDTDGPVATADRQTEDMSFLSELMAEFQNQRPEP